MRNFWNFNLKKYILGTNDFSKKNQLDFRFERLEKSFDLRKFLESLKFWSYFFQLEKIVVWKCKIFGTTDSRKSDIFLQ